MRNLLIVFGLIIGMSSYASDLLYIGDSHSHIREENPVSAKRRFGNIFYEGMKSRGYEVSYYAACGSDPSDWINGSVTECGYTEVSGGKFLSVPKSPFPSVANLYSSQSKIVINLGDNMFNWKTVAGKRVAEFNRYSFTRSTNGFLRLLKGISPRNCTWIGPTYHIEGEIYLKADAVVDEFYENLKTHLAGRCSVIDSRPVVIPSVPNDGLHHVNGDSQAWAIGVLKLI